MNEKKLNEFIDELEIDLSDRLLPDSDREILCKKAYEKALSQFYYNIYYREMVANYMSEGKVPYLPDDSNQVELIKSSIDRNITKPPYILLTVNPRPDVELKEFKKQVEKFVGRKIIDMYAYVYEVRKEDHSGLHTHVLLKYNCKPYDFKRCAKNTFKHICDISNPAVLNIRYVDADKLLQKYKYLCGDKKDDKKKGVQYSKDYRKQNCLADIYESTPELPCRGAEKKLIETEP